MTNFEKIKGLDINDMAELMEGFEGILIESCSICTHVMDEFPFCDNPVNGDKDGTCRKALIDWLNMEVENEE